MTEVTRGEFDMLKQAVQSNQARIEHLDDHGSRGVGALQLQMTEIVKDLAEMKASTATWQASHEQQHVDDKRERVSGRRWLIGTGIAGLGALGGVYFVLLDILSHVHH